MGMKPAELLRKKEAAYKELDFKNKSYTQDEIIEFMVNDPNLIERPIIEKGEKAVVARPTEKIDELF
jgi:arsenate reductase